MTKQELNERIQKIEEKQNDRCQLLLFIKSLISNLVRLNEASDIRVTTRLDPNDYREYEQEMLNSLKLAVLCFRKILRDPLFALKEIPQYRYLRNILNLIFLEKVRFRFTISQVTKEIVSSTFWENCSAQEMEVACATFEKMTAENPCQAEENGD